MLTSIKAELRTMLHSEKLDPELQAIIDQCISAKFSKKFEYLSYLILTLAFLNRMVVTLGLLEMDEDLAIRFKMLPILGVVLNMVSRTLQKEDINPRYRVLAYPIFLILSNEMVLRMQNLSQMLVVGISHNALNFILKISHLNKMEQFLLILLRSVYIAARYYFEYQNQQEGVVFRALFPSISLVMFNFLVFEIDEEINKLLNTRFNKSQAMWFKSLMNMPIGVMIYDIEASAMIFENSQFKSMIEGHGNEGKYDCELKKYAHSAETLVKEPQKKQKFMSVLEDIIDSCKKRGGSQSL